MLDAAAGEGFPFKDNGFPKNDFAYLEHRGRQLSKLLALQSKPTVIAIDGDWGAGKTYFLNCWLKAQKGDDSGIGLKNATVVYLDAFKYDFLDEPLVALLSAVQEQSPPSKFKKVIDAGKKMLPGGIRIGAAMASGGLSEAVANVTSTTASVVASSAEEMWKVEQSRITAMETFRQELQTLINSGAEDQKLVLIIDELDRCRPAYALQMLEIMKHLFEIPNTHFILGVNLSQMESLIRLQYGEGTDAARYLHRFISVTMPLRNDNLFNQSKDRPALKYFWSLVETNDVKIGSTNIGIWIRAIPSSFEVNFRDVEKILSLGSYVTSTTEAFSNLILGALIVLKICKPHWVKAMLSDDPEFADLAIAFFQLPLGALDWSANHGSGKYYDYGGDLLLHVLHKKRIASPHPLSGNIEFLEYSAKRFPGAYSYLKYLYYEHLEGFEVSN